ncbi:MAG: PAS domain-containing protein, partial [Gloeobacteraceae cyanobacterium ES-bin-316]|nr:PAS domain-containing protein [Ferruginibacter sp.]
MVRAKGRAWFGDDKTAYRFNGTLQDITKQANDRSIIEANEKRLGMERKSLHDFFTQAPAALAILKGPEHVFEFANPAYRALVGGRNPTGKTLLEALPEIAGQGFIELLDKVYKTGEAFIGKEMPISVNKDSGNLEQLYLNFTYQAFKNDHGEAEGILVFAYDVTEQISARKNIEASEKRFSNILSQSIMAIGILKGTDMVVTFANDALLDTWGKEKDLIGKPLLEVLPEIQDQGFSELLQQVYRTGVPYYGYETKVILTRNGKTEPVYYNFVYQPYTEIDNSITGITILATEVTGFVLAKKQIEESEKEQKKSAAHLKLATDSANIGIWSLDVVSLKLEWSRTHKLMWGYNDHSAELSYKDWHNAILPEDKEQAFQKMEESRVRRGIYEVAYRIRRADDHTIRSIRSVGKYYYNDEGEAETLTGISIDITEHEAAEEKIRESEDRFRNLAETIPQLIWITNEKGEYEYASGQWMKYSGLDPLAEESWLRLVHPDDMNDLMVTWKHSLATGKPYQ